MFIKAISDIQEQQEITISYVDPLLTYKERQDKLLKYGFTCACNRCLREQQLDHSWHLQYAPILSQCESLLKGDIEHNFVTAIASLSLIKEGTIFNPYTASILLTLVQTLNQAKFDFPRNQIIKIFHLTEVKAREYLNKHTKQYPQLLCKCYDLSYEFRASFEQRQEGDISVYNEVDATGEERSFS